jgi:hypothetical protein
MNVLGALDDRSDLGFVTHSFDVVPVRTNDESRVVVRVIVRAETRPTIVLATRGESRAMERVDLLAILGHERQVKMRGLLVALIEAQRHLTVGLAELDAVRRPLRGHGYSERFECLEEERFALCVIADAELDVIEHEFP